MCEVSYGQQLLSSFHGPADPMAFDYRDEWYQHGPIVSSPPKNFNKTDRQGGGGGKKNVGRNLSLLPSGPISRPMEEDSFDWKEEAEV